MSEIVSCEAVSVPVRLLSRALDDMTLPSYRAAHWRHFQTMLEEMYPDIARAAPPVLVAHFRVSQFVELSALSSQVVLIQGGNNRIPMFDSPRHSGLRGSHQHSTSHLRPPACGV